MPRPALPDFYEQVGTPLIPADMPDEIVDPADLMIPTRAQLEERQAKEKDNDSAADGADKGAGGDAGGDGSGVAGESEDDGADKGSQKTEDEEAVLAGPGNNQLQALEDPGEFVPEDRSFDVTIYDAEGKNGKSVKVSSIEQFEQLLDDDKNFGSASALLKAQRMATKLEAGQERDKAKWEEAKATYDKAQAAIQAQEAQLTQMANELNYLVAKGKLPKVATKYQEADWSDPEIAKQPGVKEQIEVLDYMKKENRARRKAGLGDIGPSAAYAEMKMEQAQAQAKDVDKQAGEARKQASARVAGVTPAPVTTAPKGVSVGRSFGSLSNLSDLM